MKMMLWPRVSLRLGLVYVAAAAILTVVFGTIYATVQQDLRLTANIASAQLAQDAAAALDRGSQPAYTPTKVDLASSLAPFVIMYDQQGHPNGASGQLNGDTPSPPSGVFDVVRSRGQARFTWQPQGNVRIAAVVVSYKNGFVLGGRNLRETEELESHTELMAALGWLVSMGLLTTVMWLWPRLRQ